MPQSKKRGSQPSRKLSLDELKGSPKDRIQEFVDVAVPVAEHVESVVGKLAGTVLDVGCGNPYLDIALAQRNKKAQMVLLHPSKKVLDSVAADMELFGLAKRAKALKGTEAKIPLKDNSVDFVVSADSIAVWHNKQQGLEEIYRVLKLGGRAYITGINWDAYRDYFGMLKTADIPQFSVHNDGDTMWIDLRKVEKGDQR